MNYIFEAFFVGGLCIALYSVINFFVSINNDYVFLFVHGFLKHLLGYILNIQAYYCNNGNACSKLDLLIDKQIYDPTKWKLFVECIGEGILFLTLGSFFYTFLYFRKYKIITIFTIGFTLHILFELLGFHKLICVMRCKTITPNVRQI